MSKSLCYNTKMLMDGREFLSLLSDNSIPVAFFDPQYRGVLDHLSYGNEGKSRGKSRTSLLQMSEDVITDFIGRLGEVLLPSGHLFLWVDKFHLCSGVQDWLVGTDLGVVDLITWDKERMGMGYRSRRVCEYLMVLQKVPRRAKGVWTRHDIRDVWREKLDSGAGTHAKPIGLQRALIEAVSNEGDVIIDPAAGTFSVLSSCDLSGRNFLGCDIALRDK